MRVRKLSDVKKKFSRNAVAAHCIAENLMRRWGFAAWSTVGESFREALISHEILVAITDWQKVGTDMNKVDIASFRDAVRYACGIDLEAEDQPSAATDLLQ